MKKVNPSNKCLSTSIKHRANEYIELKRQEGYSHAALHYYSSALQSFVSQFGVNKKYLKRHEINSAIHNIRTERALSRKTYTIYICETFAKHLANNGSAEPYLKTEEVMAKGENESQRNTLREEFKSYLINQRGLKGKTITHGVRWLERFLDHKFHNEYPDISNLTTYDIYNFISQLHGNKACRDKSIPSHLRNIFRFFHWAGLTTEDISSSVPSAKVTKNNIPRYLPYEQVDLLLNAALESPRTPLRNYAIMLLLARLGLRALEVVKIRLDDLKWNAGNIVIRGKGDLVDELPMTNEVGTAIVNYLQNERRGSSRVLFVSSNPPFRSLKNGASLRRILVDCYERTKISPPQRYIGTHIMRHSLATEMLAKGANLQEVSQLLRHRSSSTTTIYAKYSIDDLRALAKPWPGSKRST